MLCGMVSAFGEEMETAAGVEAALFRLSLPKGSLVRSSARD